MAGNQRKGGTIQLQVDGVLQEARGSFTYNLGRPKREALIGSDAVHGYTEKPQVAFIEGEITDRDSLDVAALAEMDNVTVTLQLANGKTVMLRNAWYAADGDVGTEEGNVQLRFEGKSAEEVSA